MKIKMKDGSIQETGFEEEPGFPFFLPNGLILKNLLIDYWRKLHTREGYVEVGPMSIHWT